MQNKSTYIFYAIAAILLVFAYGCKKDFLDAKTDKSLIVPETLLDFSALLDNTSIMNRSSPSSGQIASDEIWLDDATLASLNQSEKDAYSWGNRVNDYYEINDWSMPYVAVFYSNVVLDGVNKISRSPSDALLYDRIKGSALFFRAFSFYHLAQLFSPVYTDATASSELGISLRLNTDPNQPSGRATLQQTYQQITMDLKQAALLLSASVTYKSRPGKGAAYGQLARVYLSMGKFVEAERYVDTALQYNSTLMDYNDLNSALPNPFSLYNKEVIFHSELRGTSALVAGAHKVDTTLTQLYDSTDLRKKLFFEPIGPYFTFYGNYGAGDLLFNGIATNEIYLIKAECAARRTDIATCLNYLNTLLKNRYKRGSFSPLTATSWQEAIGLVLKERKKELLFRGSRWSDLKRLNTEAPYQKTITRKINGAILQLPPNDLRYQFLIPESVIKSTGIKQNPR